MNSTVDSGNYYYNGKLLLISAKELSHPGSNPNVITRNVTVSVNNERTALKSTDVCVFRC